MSKDNSIDFDNEPALDLLINQKVSTQSRLMTPDSDDENDNYASQTKGKKGLLRIVNATGYSIDGFKAAYQFEAAFRQVFWLNLILLIPIALLPFSLSIKMMLIFSSFLSLIVELFNTGIEACVDHISTDYHPLAKVAKDVGSAAQFLALALLFILWLMALTSL